MSAPHLNELDNLLAELESFDDKGPARPSNTARSTASSAAKPTKAQPTKSDWGKDS